MALAVVACLAGCALSAPSDPDGTLARVTNGTLRVGVSLEPGLVDLEKGHPSGPVADLVEDFAESINSHPEWTIGSEETLIGLLEDQKLDVLAGGFTEDSPWVDRAGITRGYADIDADERKIVFLVPLGENAFLTEIETFLDEKVGS